MGYFTTVIGDAPDHWWRLADPGGAILHDVGGNANPIPSVITEINGIPYSGMTSDGLCAVRVTNTGLIKASSLIVLGTSWTLEVWAWLFKGNGDQQIIELVGGATGQRIGIRHILATGQTIFYDTLTGVITNVATPADNKWHHYVFTYDHVTLRTYVDGVAGAVGLAVIATADTYAMFILSDTAGGTAALGFAEDVATYIYQLAAFRIAAHFAAADQILSSPVFQGGAGLYPNATQSTALTAVDIAAILAAVRRTFPTT